MPDQTPRPETRTRARAVLDALLPGVRDRAVDALGPVEGEGLAARLEQHHLDLLAPLDRLYVTDDVTLAALAGRLVDRVVEAAIDRPVALRALDRRREVDPGWFQRARMVGYVAYADRFAGDLAGVRQRLVYLAELGVTYLHLMPLLQPREGDNDGGYAVQDYRAVRADLGAVEDLRELTRGLRTRGISLVLDLVLNHVAREHEWAVRARAGEGRYRDYFYVYPDRAEPDAYERTLPEVFPDFAPGSFTWDEDLSGWVWTTFNEWQWDVNWSNPEVLLEYADIVLFLANLGVEVLRLDAIAFTWKRLGTNCQNQPEVHALTQVLRTVARIACPATVFKAEAIVGPRDLVQYLGLGPRAGRVSDLAYHNSLMVQVWSMLAAGNVVLARQALASLPPTPHTGTWVCYVRCHDDIGWAIDDDDARAVGLDGFAHRRFLSDWYAGEFPGSWAHGLVFQHNPVTGDRRISGTAASLTGLAGGAVPEESAGLARMFLAHAIVAGWGGIPVVWSGDELGLPNDPRWAEEEGHADDNRWAHRPRLDWAVAKGRADLRTPQGRVFQGLAHLARVRASLPQLHAAADSEVLMGTDDGVLATVRRHPSGPMVCVYNVTDSWRPFPLGHLAEAGITDPFNALGAHAVYGGTDGRALLSPYAAWWVVEASSLPAAPGSGRG